MAAVISRPGDGVVEDREGCKSNFSSFCEARNYLRVKLVGAPSGAGTTLVKSGLARRRYFVGVPFSLPHQAPQILDLITHLQSSRH